ncbi:hypothetical protein [Gemmata obscuriglobus]|uniref:hypothetical protein n=1 Tax=Gemmata obscuriglobus TaxID=114 RepID=UPI0011CEC8EB|nr:hypothetical protein [Gemmata obscuriglobus]
MKVGETELAQARVRAKVLTQYEGYQVAETNRPTAHNAPLLFFFATAFIVVLAWGVYWALIVNAFKPDESLIVTDPNATSVEKERVSAKAQAIDRAHAARGQFGDMFGAINALFSALALAVLIYTMWLQRKSLAETQEEMRLARTEAARQADTASRTALIGALSALWEHYNSVGQATGSNRGMGDGDPKAVKQELASAIFLLAREDMAKNSTLFRPEQQIRLEASEMVQHVASMISTISESPPGQWAHATRLEETRKRVEDFVSKIKLHIDPSSEASEARAELLSILEGARPGPSYALASVGASSTTQPNNSQEQRNKALTLLRSVQDLLHTLINCNYAAPRRQ